MALTTQIQLNTKGYLDLNENIVVPLNFAIAEIQDISKRQGGYSKTIQLPGTANNHKLFGQLFDVNITNGTFNPSKKEDCIILQNGVPVFEGGLQLTNVKKQAPALPNGDEFIIYEVAVKDETGDFYSDMSEKLLSDFDFSQYNHIYTLSAVTATSGNTWEDVYKYHLLYNLKQEYNIDDFKPGIFAKAYWDRIFAQSGYSYTWESMSATGFDKLIIPYNGDSPVVNNANFNVYAGFVDTQPLGNISNVISYPIEFDDDSTIPFEDPDNAYNTGSGTWEPTLYGTAEMKTKYTYEVYLSTPIDIELWNFNTTPQEFGFKVFHRLNLTTQSSGINVPVNNAECIVSSSSYPQNSLGFPSTGATLALSAGDNLVASGVTDEISAVFPIQPGFRIKNELEAVLEYGKNDGSMGWVDPSLTAFTAEPTIKIRIAPIQPTNPALNYLRYTVNATTGEGQLLELNKYVPKQVKQKDFFASIVKMFNLYVTPDPNKSKHLFIQTRDEFYDSGGVKDWTSKLDRNKEVKLQFLPDLQDKKLLLSYKEDKDVFNTHYKETTNEIYGQLQYNFDNDFVDGVKKIEPIFSPTPLETNRFGNVVPTIDSGKPKNNIRILYDGDWIDGDWTYRVSSGFTTTTQFTQYPYAGHLAPTPISPLVDYNFGKTDYLYYDTADTLPNNNLYNKYYKRFISQIESGKLMTAYFRLNEVDISNLDFRDRIFIQDTYWFINKISDYNANSKGGLTKVELINTDTGFRFDPTLSASTVTGGRFGHLGNSVTIKNSFEKDNRFGNGVGYVSVNGTGNYIANNTYNSVILGNNNYLAGNNNLVSGSNNLVMGNNVTVLGRDNLDLVSLSSNILSATTSGQTYTSGLPIDNTLYVSNLDVENQITLSGTNLFQYIQSTNLFISGSSGVSSIRANNNTTTDATGDYSLAIGTNAIASGLTAMAMGNSTIAGGNYSHAKGFQSKALGQVSFAEGNATTASGDFSHSEGYITTASGLFTHAEGAFTTASGDYSHAEGNSTVSSGSFSHAEGTMTRAAGQYSHAGGYSASTTNNGEWARSSNELGQYGIISWGRQTTGATGQIMYINTGTGEFALPTNRGVRLDIKIIATTQANGVEKIINISAGYDNISGTLTNRYSTNDVVFETVALASADVTLSITGTTIRLTATGIAATNINWFAKGEYVYSKIP